MDVEGKGLNTGAHKAAAIFDEVEREQPGSTCSKAMSCRVSKSMTASVKALYSALPAFQHGGRHRIRDAPQTHGRAASGDRDSCIRTATTRPEPKVNAAATHIAAGNPNASAVTPASTAPTA